MGLLIQTGIIAATALKTGVPCDQVFKKIAYLAYPANKQDIDEHYMDELAFSACSTKNPDEIWQIVSTETNFQFRIVRINNSEKVLKGQNAIKYLKRMKKSQKRENIDIGAMQLNWYWHNESFQKDPLKMLAPSEQVKYLVEDFRPSLVKRCKGEWIGCYHNPTNGKRARIYLNSIKNSRELLKKGAEKFQKSNTPSHIPFRAMSCHRAAPIDTINQNPVVFLIDHVMG